MPDLKFTPPHVQKPGIIAAILKICYADLVASDPELWDNETEGWERFDSDVYEDPAAIGNSTFLSWLDDKLIGFASFDPRQWPAYGIIGHNCILPEFQGQGFGKHQIEEILRVFGRWDSKGQKFPPSIMISSIQLEICTLLLDFVNRDGSLGRGARTLRLSNTNRSLNEAADCILSNSMFAIFGFAFFAA